jgi:hypothetical protein
MAEPCYYPHDSFEQFARNCGSAVDSLTMFTHAPRVRNLRGFLDRDPSASGL